MPPEAVDVIRNRVGAATARGPLGGSHLTDLREDRRVGHHRMGDRLVPPGAVDYRVNDARSSSEPEDSSLYEQHLQPALASETPLRWLW